MYRLLFLAAFSLLGAACFASTPDRDAFVDLTESQRALIVADTEEWADGGVCQGECDGPTDFDEFADASWIRVDRVIASDDFEDTVELVLHRFGGDDPSVATSSELSLMIEGEDSAEFVAEAFDRKLELWAVSPTGFGEIVEHPWGYLLAFDDEGRVTSIGQASAPLISEPIAVKSDEAGIMPRQYFLESVYEPAVERLLTMTDPGGSAEEVGSARLIGTDTCVQLGRGGPTLVFPAGTVKERGYGDKGVDVFDNWSGLTELPFQSVVGAAGRVEVTGKRTTLTELGVPANTRCPDEAIFVKELRVRIP